MKTLNKVFVATSKKAKPLHKDISAFETMKSAQEHVKDFNLFQTEDGDDWRVEAYERKQPAVKTDASIFYHARAEREAHLNFAESVKNLEDGS